MLWDRWLNSEGEEEGLAKEIRAEEHGEQRI